MSAGKHRAPGGAGRSVQGVGRHTERYLRSGHAGRGVGMYPMGAAGRQSLEQLHEGPQDRGDRYSQGEPDE